MDMAKHPRANLKPAQRRGSTQTLDAGVVTRFHLVAAAAIFVVVSLFQSKASFPSIFLFRCRSCPLRDFALFQGGHVFGPSRRGGGEQKLS